MNKVELCDYGRCTQCYACEVACPKKSITFVPSIEGFVVPKIDATVCVECGVCSKVCHQINPVPFFKTPIKNFACWTKNTSDRKKSSSGGAFSVIARQIIQERGVVFGACMGEDLKVRHICIHEAKDIILLQGSKYVQSYMGDTYMQVKKELLDERKVLFSGTPCQVAGLYGFLKKKYDNLYTCDVVCHGVPSQKAFDVYIEKVGLKGKCKDFGFRYTKGWGFQLSALLVSKNGKLRKKIISPINSYYLRAFKGGLMFNEACYTCVYAKTERISDFTMADYWGLGAKVPFSHSTKMGVSCLLVNNEKALGFIKRCNNLEFEERPLEEAVEGNHNLSNVSIRPSGRDTYFNDSQNMSIKSLCAKYGIKATIRDYLRIFKQMLWMF